MSETRRHPDLFSAAEAVEYLHLDSVETFEKLRDAKLIRPYKVGRNYDLYWRQDLDDCALRIVGETPEPRRPKLTPMKMVGQ